MGRLVIEDDLDLVNVAGILQAPGAAEFNQGRAWVEEPCAITFGDDGGLLAFTQPRRPIKGVIPGGDFDG